MRTLVRTRTVTSHMIFTCRKSANSWEIITAFPCAFTGTGHGHGLSYHTTRTYTHNHEQTRASRAVRCWVGARRQQKCRTGGEGASPRLGHPCGPCITILCRRSAAGLVALSVAAVQSTTYVHPYRSSAGVRAVVHGVTVALDGSAGSGTGMLARGISVMPGERCPNRCLDASVADEPSSDGTRRAVPDARDAEAYVLLYTVYSEKKQSGGRRKRRGKKG